MEDGCQDMRHVTHFTQKSQDTQRIKHLVSLKTLRVFTIFIDHTMSTKSSLLTTLNPQLRIQVLLENEAVTPTKEFKAGAAMSEPMFDALVAHVFGMTSFDTGSLDEYNITFKYRIEERHGSQWINFDSTEGLGFALENNQGQGYIFLSANITKKGADIPTLMAPSPVRFVNGSVKPKVAKKARPTKHKASSSSSKGAGSKKPLGPFILSTLKDLLDLGIDSPPRLQVALFVGYTNVDSATFKETMKKLEVDRSIEVRSKDTVSLTEAGAALAPSITTPATTNVEVQARLKSMVKAKGPLIFDILCDGRSHVSQIVAEAVGHKNVQSAGFKDPVKQMKSLKILEHPEGDKNRIRLTNMAFPFGRPIVEEV
jgi:hypothetical protein